MEKNIIGFGNLEVINSIDKRIFFGVMGIKFIKREFKKSEGRLSKIMNIDYFLENVYVRFVCLRVFL